MFLSLKRHFLNEKFLLDALVLSGSLYTALSRVWSSFPGFLVSSKANLTREAYRFTFLIQTLPSY